MFFLCLVVDIPLVAFGFWGPPAPAPGAAPVPAPALVPAVPLVPSRATACSASPSCSCPGTSCSCSSCALGNRQGRAKREKRGQCYSRDFHVRLLSFRSGAIREQNQGSCPGWRKGVLLNLPNSASSSKAFGRSSAAETKPISAKDSRNEHG